MKFSFTVMFLYQVLHIMTLNHDPPPHHCVVNEKYRTWYSASLNPNSGSLVCIVTGERLV